MHIPLAPAPLPPLDGLRTPDPLIDFLSCLIKAEMPQKFFQGMHFSEASRILHICHDFDHIKNNRGQLLWWGNHNFFYWALTIFETSYKMLGIQQGPCFPGIYVRLWEKRDTVCSLFVASDLTSVLLSSNLSPGGWPEWFVWGVSKLWSMGHIWVGTSVCMACELRIISVVLNGWERNLKTDISWHKKIIWNASFRVCK